MAEKVIVLWHLEALLIVRTLLGLVLTAISTMSAPVLAPLAQASAQTHPSQQEVIHFQGEFARRKRRRRSLEHLGFADRNLVGPRFQ